jgi:hypothetical protein
MLITAKSQKQKFQSFTSLHPAYRKEATRHPAFFPYSASGATLTDCQGIAALMKHQNPLDSNPFNTNSG